MELEKVYFGKKFKELNPGVQFYKILSEDMIHHGFQYKLGKNVDILPFNPSGYCEPGGLYFTTFEHVFKYLSFGTKIGIIEIPDHAFVYVEDEQYKTDQFNITRIVSILSFINQSDDMCKIAVKQNGFAIKYIKDQKKKYCETAVKNNGLALEHVKYQTNKICKLAVKQNPLAIRYIRCNSEEPDGVRIRKNTNVICYIRYMIEKFEYFLI